MDLKLETDVIWGTPGKEHYAWYLHGALTALTNVEADVETVFSCIGTWMQMVKDMLGADSAPMSWINSVINSSLEALLDYPQTSAYAEKIIKEASKRSAEMN